MYKLTPAPGYLVVEPIPSEKFNESKLATLANDKEHVSTGKVLAVSKYAGVFENYAKEVSTEATEGDLIAYISYTESPLKLNGKELHLLRFDRVTAIISEKK